MNEQIAYWVARGKVRRDCPHRHRTEETAAACARKDHRECASLGGGAYSDRYAIPIDYQGYEVADD